MLENPFPVENVLKLKMAKEKEYTPFLVNNAKKKTVVTNFLKNLSIFLTIILGDLKWKLKQYRQNYIKFDILSQNDI